MWVGDKLSSVLVLALCHSTFLAHMVGEASTYDKVIVEDKLKSRWHCAARSQWIQFWRVSVMKKATFWVLVLQKLHSTVLSIQYYDAEKTCLKDLRFRHDWTCTNATMSVIKTILNIQNFIVHSGQYASNKMPVIKF